MISILALSVIGSWSYASFVADPTPLPPPSSVIPPAVAPSQPGLKEKSSTVPRKDTPESLQTRVKLEAPSPPIATRPTLSRSTDALGQTWEHPDAAYLASFIEARNRSFVSSYSASPPPYRSSQCVTGRCN